MCYSLITSSALMGNIVLLSLLLHLQLLLGPSWIELDTGLAEDVGGVALTKRTDGDHRYTVLSKSTVSFGLFWFHLCLDHLLSIVRSILVILLCV